ncbi:MAG: malate synthase A [SAR202 cluster bacterium]|nr:malate synthase A [SAR202 cluster bacterium]|tara:strand:+ start:33647 stop:35221 length:1575 start_codon:yes stop_codon:yes gene_type:complete
MQIPIQVLGKQNSVSKKILTEDALEFVAGLAKQFETSRAQILVDRKNKQRAIDAGSFPSFLAETSSIREGKWRVARISSDLDDRRVEITGPSSNRTMFINAMNSGAQIYMTDFEDAHSPQWDETMQGQVNVYDAVRRAIESVSASGRKYTLNDKLSVLCIRPRGWHLDERHVLVDGFPVSASLFDFGLAFFHNAKRLIDSGSGPYFYLPKMQGYGEARLWNEVFTYAQNILGVPNGSIKATVLIEHILAVFEIDEIIYELRDHISGLNLGRWDYIYSVIKTFNKHPDFVLPDRSEVTMNTKFLESAAKLVVSASHKRGIHALGGMSTYIPRRDDHESNENAMQAVRTDKQREADQGFDGAWVAHPGLVEPVGTIFDEAFSGANQLNNESAWDGVASDLLTMPTGQVSESGVRNNISVAIKYIEAWVQGIGAVAINGLMEDTATAEIARAQLWQWIRYEAKLPDGIIFDEELYRQFRSEEVEQILVDRVDSSKHDLDKAVDLLDQLVLSSEFVEFLTVLGDRFLD